MSSLVILMLKDHALYEAESLLTFTLASVYGLFLLNWRLRRRRQELAILTPILAAFALRVLVVAGVALTPVASTLRGGDEGSFLGQARDLAAEPLTSDASLSVLTSQLQTWSFALQIRIFDAPELALRVTQASIATIGLALMATALHDLAGPRAATIGAWLLALEPASVFFSGVLHKESLMLLAEGLVAFGGAQVWRRPDLRAVAPLALGCAIAVATRPYAGWFLIAAAGAITFHASLRGRRRSPGASVTLAGLVVVLVVLTAPTIRTASSEEKLAGLQSSQDANANDESNLQLEPIDYSTASGIAFGLPRRIRDVLLRPYPWQVENLSQRLGLIGTLAAIMCIAALVVAVIRRPKDIMIRAGPLVYMAGLLLIAYALSAGNAGTAFRYRTHIVAVGVCIVVALYQRERGTRLADAGARSFPAPAVAQSL